VFWLLLVVISVGLALVASRIGLEEDVTKVFPDDERVENLNYVFQNAKFAERIVVMVSVNDSSIQAEPDSLVAIADKLVARIGHELGPQVKEITSRVNEERILELFDIAHEYLPTFLTSEDFAYLGSLVEPDNIRLKLQESFRQIISPSGIALKRTIIKDPLGLSFLALNKLRQLQYANNFELYDGYIITKDHRHLIFFVHPAYSPNETGKNSDLITQLHLITTEASGKHAEYLASYFGAVAVAVGNADQLRKDTILTISILVLILALLLIGFFRKKRVPFLILLPVAFGVLFALSCIYLLKGSVSILAIAAGAVVLGIAVNYALHFLTHLKHVHDVKRVVKDLAWPMTLGSATTVLAFFCLQFANAGVLRDVGLFAGFSLIGAAFFSLVFLPHLIGSGFFGNESVTSSVHSGFPRPKLAKWLPWAILVITPFFLYKAFDVSFNSDMTRLNFMTADLREAQARLESINNSSLSASFIVSKAPTLEQALQNTERITLQLQKLMGTHQIDRFSSVSTFMVSDSLQRERIRKWNEFWTPEKKQSVIDIVRREARSLKFSEQVIDNFERQIEKEYVAAGEEVTQFIRASFFDDYIIEKDTTSTVITLMNVDANKKDEVYKMLEENSINVVDRQMLTNLLIEYVNADFNFIVSFTAILVVIALFLSYGRIELTLITFAPMFITWIWILGIMAIVGIEFNIVNVMVSTFIFGLGDDYSIFIMDGLQHEYQTGKKNLPSIRISILLSAATTIAGLGVLMLASHPALRSIASISIIGIFCVFVMSQTIEPFLFRALITRRAEKGLPPMTWRGILRTSVTYAFFVVGAIGLTMVGLVFRLIPFGKDRVRLAFHVMICLTTRFLIYVEPSIGKRILGKTPDTFVRASILIANHSSFLDILLTTMMHPKLILLTNEWVWNSPVFGGVVRLARYYPVMDGAVESVDRLRESVNDGFSVVVFPEGKRSPDGRIGRFHKGAFFMAESLGLPIQPLIIHGAAQAIPKGSFYLNDGRLTLKFLQPIEADNKTFGDTYSERAKQISALFKDEYEILARQVETPDYFRKKLITSYLYKGPILEWYLRIKIRLERNYEVFHEHLPQQGNILDLGCGYGFLCYMLYFLSSGRKITGVDYDEEKIDTATHNYLRTERIEFRCGDVTQFQFAKYDGIVISDVLHYLTPGDQEKLLVRCFDALNPGGVLMVREGNSDLKERHWGTRLTEFFSVHLLRFNKSTHALSFVSGEGLKRLSTRHGLDIAVVDDAKFTSNVTFVISKKG
jgi:1-acyl-sn-glycerol-3-phosphate acyltransferase